MKTIPDFCYEIAHGGNVAGLDEVGRGPICGPVVAAAVIFPKYDIEIPIVIRDSKQMTPNMRDMAYDWIVNNTIWAIGECSPHEIDELNILWASMRAMERAVANLPQRPDFCLVDGNRVPKNLNGVAIVKGDAKSLSIAAASIVAKVSRDRYMAKLGILFPQYGWDKNAGYPTPQHLNAIKNYGINEHYRRSFGPVKEILENETAYD
ncbi:MAG: ribonuclease HII [Alphaproteobacteria bacterium]|nr:ribonuclease HII [Alphaproteobacteria bacterium]